MKRFSCLQLFLLLIIVLFLGCNSSDNPALSPIINQHNGFWEIKLTGDLSGAALFAVSQNGSIKNGIPIKYFDSVEIITYVSSGLDGSGWFNSDFYCEKMVIVDTAIINYKSTSGYFYGIFKDSTASGSYEIKLNNVTFDGTWLGKKLK